MTDGIRMAGPAAVRRFGAALSSRLGAFRLLAATDRVLADHVGLLGSASRPHGSRKARLRLPHSRPRA